MNPRLFRFLLNIYPPYLGTGIVVKHVADDYSRMSVQMKSRFYNRNYVGTHFGGSLYAMTDPFYMLMLIHHLGPDYVVWDKAATIRFRNPGRGRVSAEFRLSEAQIDEIREELEVADRFEPTFTVQVKDEVGTLIAEVDKVLHVKKKTGQ